MNIKAELSRFSVAQKALKPQEGFEVFFPNSYVLQELPYGVTQWGAARGCHTGACQFNERADLWSARFFFGSFSLND